MIIAKNGDWELWHDECRGYAVFERICYPSGTTAFWQQKTKWYIYKKYAMNIYNGKTEGKTV